jgi:hypothetical protein
VTSTLFTNVMPSRVLSASNGSLSFSIPARATSAVLSVPTLTDGLTLYVP